MRNREGLIFANARAKSKENGLMSEERLHRIMESKTVEDILRILSEMNFAGGMIVQDGDFYSLLKEEERIATAFAVEASPKGIGFECFFLKNDYHNLKVLLKQKYARLEDISEMIMPDGEISFSELKTRLEEGKLNDNYMSEGVKTIEKAFERGEGSPRLIDTEMDKALFRNIRSRLGSCDECIKEYFISLVDLTNIETWVRCNRINADKNFFASSFVDGGTIDLKQFEEYGTDEAKFKKMILNSKYASFSERVEKGDLAVFETAQDDFLLKIISKDKADMFSVAPILGYYLAKMNEIKILRVILVSVKNKVSYEEMKKRVRALYA